MGGAISVPEGKCSVVNESGIASDGTVCSAIFAVKVVELGGSDHRMVQSGIKSTANGAIRRFYNDLRELIVPGGLGAGDCPREIPARKFLPEVVDGIVNTNGRKSDFDEERGVEDIIEIEAGEDISAGKGIGIMDFLPVTDLHDADIARKSGDKVESLRGCPAGRVAISGDSTIVEAYEMGVDGPIPPDSILKIDHEVGKKGIGGVRVAMEADAGSSGKLDINTIAVEMRGIVPRAHAFIDTAKGGGDSIVAEWEPSRDGEQGDVSEVPDTGTAEVGMGETDDGSI
jgi:hypothetical protein